MLRISKKKGLRLPILVVAMVIVCTTCISFPASAGNDVVILYMNDIHGRLESFKPQDAEVPLGGLIKLATLIEDIVGENADNVIVLNAGDSLHGTNIVNLFEGRPMVEALESIGTDAMAIGNHEFNYGQAALLKRADEAKFAFLSANTVDSIVDVRCSPVQ